MPNSFGHLFRITTWGESHGPGIGVVIDGCPPLLPITAEEIQKHQGSLRERQGIPRSQVTSRDSQELEQTSMSLWPQCLSALGAFGR